MDLSRAERGFVILSDGKGGIARVVARNVEKQDIGSPEAEFSHGIAKEVLKRGEYLVYGPAHCVECHVSSWDEFMRAAKGEKVALRGGFKFVLGPLGHVYSRNLTPDPETGIGRWTDAQVMNAIRRGERPDGTRLFPIHAYTYFVHIADDEAQAMVAYLKSVKPVKHNVPARNLKGPAPNIPLPESPKVAPVAGVARGEYLVKGPSHCGDCHTPHRPGGGQDLSKFLAGGPGPEGTTPPNITPHPVTGIGRWTEEQVVQAILAGTRPNGTALGSLMRVVVQGSSVGYKDMRREDPLAIARYLKTIPAIDNRVR